MEGFELIATGLWSIVPPILALVLALITKEVYSSLTIGVFTGMFIYQCTLIGVGGEQRGRCCYSLRFWERLPWSSPRPAAPVPMRSG